MEFGRIIVQNTRNVNLPANEKLKSDRKQFFRKSSNAKHQTTEHLSLSPLKIHESNVNRPVFF